jgi:3-phosphoshikimate 1-carboxyvinyltransferase
MKHNILLTKKSKSVTGTVQLTGSKSECNRALVIGALSNGKVKVKNISDAADAVTLNKILSLKSEVESQDSGLIAQDLKLVDIGPAGTAMRFLTAYYAIGDQEVVLTGSARMKQRPIGILVDALRKLGANIEYEENEGYPPIRLKGSFEQLTRKISIKGDIWNCILKAS